MDYLTADLSDRYGEQVAIVETAFCNYGGRKRFHGVIETVKAAEDNSRVRECLSEPGSGKVLVIDCGASMRCAMLGDMLAKSAVLNGWAGVVINGCIRDSAEIAKMLLGVKALGTHPRKTEKRGLGKRNMPVSFGGVTFLPGHYLYADEDGILVSRHALEPSGS